MWRRVFWWKNTSVSDPYASSIFREAEFWPLWGPQISLIGRWWWGHSTRRLKAQIPREPWCLFPCITVLPWRWKEQAPPKSWNLGPSYISSHHGRSWSYCCSLWVLKMSEVNALRLRHSCRKGIWSPWPCNILKTGLWVRYFRLFGLKVVYCRTSPILLYDCVPTSDDVIKEIQPIFSLLWIHCSKFS
jgi:hypothetical protein